MTDRLVVVVGFVVVVVVVVFVVDVVAAEETLSTDVEALAAEAGAAEVMTLKVLPKYVEFALEFIDDGSTAAD